MEKKLARKHLKGGCLAPCDVSSSYAEGRCRDLARFGYNRDGKKGKPPKCLSDFGNLKRQIVYGLLCAADGCRAAYVERPRGQVISSDDPSGWNGAVICTAFQRGPWALASMKSASLGADQSNAL